ncbi:Ferredoxin--NADP reductase [Commensalibacter sp. Nvir]|uniref:NAD(P)/FAD-dependent oxidoreductase n=1 Tax=Commensalibacter sp. Nvir TaxID=3069817 RepID=UPI002D41FB2F|nr:Ferredoxin--NADP reductase [Commensalibacter sp. Nvir]
MTKLSLNTDIAIIGAGPAGLFAAFECNMLKMNCVLIDALRNVGGQCSALYPEKPIFDIPAHPSITAQSLIDSLEKQIEPFSVPRLLSQTVIKIEGEKNNFLLTTHTEDSIQTKAVFIAAGAGSFGPNRPPLENIEIFEEGGCIHYYVRHSEQFTGQDIVIAGGGDSAVDWALALKDKAKSITLIHRRDRFRATPESIHRLDSAVLEQKIIKEVPFQLHKLHGEKGKLNSIDIISSDKTIKSLKADHLLAFFGLTSDLTPLSTSGLDIQQNRIPVTPATCQTNIEGIYAIGDIASYPGKLKLILQGFSEAALASHAAYSVVFPNTALHFEHSTSLGISS